MQTVPGFIMVLLCVTFVVLPGCTDQTAPPVPDTTTPVPFTGTVLPPATGQPAPTYTPVPTPLPPQQATITDGFWCRDTTMNLGKAPTKVRECYQFLPDGTFRWGYSPGKIMGKSPSCWAPDTQCTYALTAKGQYEVSGGYYYTVAGDTLIDPHDPPYYTRSLTGIP